MMRVNNENSIYNQGVSMSQVNSAISEATSQLATGYTPKGEADVATLNGISGQENGWLYTMTDSGTLTDGSLAVVAGDTVAWDETNSVWYKAMEYAPRQYGTNEAHNLPTSIPAFRTGDVIAVDGPSGTAKMSKDDLLKETAENALGSIHLLSDTAPEADLVAGNFLALDGSAGTKKLPADVLASKSEVAIYDKLDEISLSNNLFLLSDGSRVYNAAYQIVYYPCEPGDEFYVKGTISGSVTVANVYSSAPVSSANLVSNLINHSGNTAQTYNQKITIPAGGKYIAITQLKSVSAYERTALYKFVGIQQYFDDYNEKTNAYNDTLLTPDNTIDNVYLVNDGTTTSNSAYRVVVYELVQGKKYKLKGRASGYIAVCNSYKSATIGSADFVSCIKNHNSLTPTDYDEEIIIPLLATHIAITQIKSLGDNATALYEEVPVDMVGLNTRVNGIDSRVSELEAKQNNRIVCWGDSLTYGYGASETGGVPYPQTLQTLVGNDFLVLNEGISGDSIQRILGRQGSLPAVIDSDVTISKTAWSYTDVNLASADGKSFGTFAQGLPDDELGNKVNGIKIGSKSFWTKYNISTQKMQLCVTSAQADNIELKKGDLLQFGATQRCLGAFASIFFVGTNGSYDATDEFIKYVSDAIRFSGSKNFLVVGLTYIDANNSLAKREEEEEAMQTAFGLNYVNLRQYFVSHGLEDAGITPTAQDLTDISEGKVPTSLRYDNIHYNATGYELLGTLLYNRGKNLGWW